MHATLGMGWTAAIRQLRAFGGGEMQVFVQSAYLEWHPERSPSVPRTILALGFKAFATPPGFVAAYVAFLLSQGDVDNARQLFERSLAQPEPPLAIWDAYVAVRDACTS